MLPLISSVAEMRQVSGAGWRWRTDRQNDGGDFKSGGKSNELRAG